MDTYTEHNPFNPINQIEVDADYVPTVTDNYNAYNEEVPEPLAQYIVHLERKVSLAKKDISVVVEALDQTDNGLALLLKKVLINLKRE